ncbi:uncharacterized abhydrolase domain-containing protein DDB_G0269086-like [Centropristis striata]|uniref:uncharacterized abhydrolase domain-containing protein DDB_G0269086-like n=1 Tax=Centropristis striata TaxID=184440 RepID=UPI0027E1AA14|nr:uncharacterized abhydrolase domain-containing protein DDB_G0269086-like [Centropristis striata]
MPGKKKKQGQRGIDAAAMLEFMNDCPTEDEFYHSPMEMQKNSLANKNNTLTMPGKKKKQRGIDAAAMLEFMNDCPTEDEPPMTFYHSPVEMQKNSLANKNNTLTMPGKEKKQQGIDAAAMLESMNDDYSMEDEPPKKFYHTPMEMQKSTLANYMDQFREQKDVEHQTCNTKDQQAELEQVKAENEALKDQLQSAKQQQEAAEKHYTELQKERNPWNLKAQLQAEKDKNSRLMASLKEAKQDKSSLMAQLEKSKATHLAQQEMQTKENENTMTEMKKKLEDQLQSAKQLKAEKEALQNELEAKNNELRAEKRQIAVEKTKVEMELENTLLYEMAQLQAEKDKSSRLMASLKEAEQDKSSLLAQLDEKRRVNATIVAALKEVEKQLEDKTSLLAQLKKSQATYHAQSELQAEKHRNTVAALKKDLEDQLESSRLQWQQEKTSLLEESEKARESYVSQLEEKKRDNNTVVAALKEVEKQLKIGQLQWQEDKTSLTAQLVITNQRDTDLAEQIQRWEARERGMREDNKYLEKRFRDQLAETKSWQDIALDQYSKRGFWFGKKKIDDRDAELERMKRKMQEKEEKNRIVHGDKVVEEAAACQ